MIRMIRDGVSCVKRIQYIYPITWYSQRVFFMYSKVLFISSRMVSESFLKLVYEYYAFFVSLLQFSILGVSKIILLLGSSCAANYP